MSVNRKNSLFDGRKIPLTRRVSQFLQKHTLTILLILAAAFFSAGTYLTDETVTFLGKSYNWWGRVFHKASELIVVSAIISALLQWLKYRRFFQDAIFEATHSNEYLKTRTKSDLDSLWDRVTRIAYDEKFPELNEPLLDRVKSGYLPKNKDFYYQDYNRTCNVHWVDGKEGIILQLKDRIEFTIVPHREGKNVEWIFHFKRSPGVPKDAPNGVDLGNILVNGKLAKPRRKRAEENGPGDLVYVISLRGAESYYIVRESTRIFSPHVDPYSVYTSPQFTLGVSVKVHCHPNDVRVKFIGLGTLDDFRSVNPPLERDRIGDVDRRHSGMVFPQQGYALVWQIVPDNESEILNEVDEYLEHVGKDGN